MAVLKLSTRLSEPVGAYLKASSSAATAAAVVLGGLLLEHALDFGVVSAAASYAVRE